MEWLLQNAVWIVLLGAFVVLLPAIRRLNRQEEASRGASSHRHHEGC